MKSNGNFYYLAVFYKTARKKDYGLNKPDNQTHFGNDKSEDQSFSYFILISKSLIHKVNFFNDG